MAASKAPAGRGRRLDALPNLLTGIRLALAIPVILAAVAERKGWFVGFLLTAGLTEFDGTVARWLGVESEFGRRFDSWADLAIETAALIGVAFVFPDVVHANWWYYVAGGLALTVPIAFALLTRGEPFGFHTLLARFSGAWVSASAIAFLLTGWIGGLRLAALIEVGVALEYFTIAALGPSHRGGLPSVVAAVRLRGRVAGSVGS
ncbi:MAG: CDP-alcohol phosphatidyltransferase family protein [Gemmatimonadales bacterium]